jgi:hypothetical protein
MRIAAAHLTARPDAACSKLSLGESADLKPAKHLACPLELTLTANNEKGND